MTLSARHDGHGLREDFAMAHYTHQAAPTQSVEAYGIHFTYRRFNKPNGVPLVFIPRDFGLLGSGHNRRPRQEPRGDSFQ
jgi:hypothetical protein